MSARSSGWLLLLCLLACDKTPDAPAFEGVRSWTSRTGFVAIDWSPDGKTLLLGEALSDSLLWYAPWKRSVVLPQLPGQLRAARFVATDRVLMASSTGGIALFAAASGAELRRSQVTLEQVTKLGAVSASGRFVAFDSAVYDLDSNRWAARVPLPASLTSLGFAGDRAALVSGFHDSELSLLALDGSAARQWLAPDKIASAAISDDGRYVAASATEEIVIWSVGRTEPLCDRSMGAHTYMLRFAPEGTQLVVATKARLQILRSADCAEQGALKLHATASALDLDGNLVAVGDSEGYVYVWDRARSKLVAVERVFQHSVYELRVHAATSALIAATSEANGSEARLLTIPNSAAGSR